jgi:hypothetical protein
MSDRLQVGDTCPVAPDFVSRYYLADRRPLLNLSELDDASIAAIDREMAALRAAGRQFRPFGPRYMQWRRLTERRMRELFVDRGGRPERTAPHYFVLGGSRWFEGLAIGMRQCHRHVVRCEVRPTRRTEAVPRPCLPA